MRNFDTIFALATPPGRSALAVVRVSGPAAGEVLGRLCRGAAVEPRVATLRGLHDPGSGEKIDDALVTYFPAPKSFTGEDCLELSIHGGRSVIASLLAALSRSPGVRPAEAGEFSRRAFLNGKLDLTQAEAIADLIDSETEFQRKQALRVLDGALGRRVASWREGLIRIASEIEGLLDFSDEADVHDAARLDLDAECARLQQDMALELAAGRKSAALRDGFTIVIAGPPNTGKSSLFNALVGRDTAIVTDVPGTTRDLIVARLDLGGAPVTLIDSAGLRATDDPVETIGIERARGAANRADLVLWLSPNARDAAPDLSSPILMVASKSDLTGAAGPGLSVSIYDPASIETLEAELRRRALDTVGDGSEGGLIRERHIRALQHSMSALIALRANLRDDLVELAAEDCRSAIAALEEIVGAITTETILGAIFQSFCIGK